MPRPDRKGGPPHRDPRHAVARSRLRRGVGVLGLAVALPLAGCAALDERLRLAVFRPSTDAPPVFDALRAGDRILRVPADDPARSGQWVELWWMPADDPRAPTLLYLHGTYRNLYRNHPKMQAIREAGFSVLAVEYRGWGGSSPLVPSEETVSADAETGWRELVRRQPDPRRRVVYGHSMGSGVAVGLAARHASADDHGGLILESAFGRAADVAVATSALLAPLTWVRDLGFDARGRIAEVRVPLLMLHGEADRTVPIELGRALFDAARAPRTFVSFERGSHSRLHEDDPECYRAELAAFAQTLRAPPSPQADGAAELRRCTRR